MKTARTALKSGAPCPPGRLRYAGSGRIESRYPAPPPGGRGCAFTGTYGDYLPGKVSKVFPPLRRQVLTDEAP